MPDAFPVHLDDRPTLRIVWRRDLCLVRERDPVRLARALQKPQQGGAMGVLAIGAGHGVEAFNDSGSIGRRAAHARVVLPLGSPVYRQSHKRGALNGGPFVTRPGRTPS